MNGLREHFDTVAEMRAHYKGVRARTRDLRLPVLVWSIGAIETIPANRANDLAHIFRHAPAPIPIASAAPIIRRVKAIVCERYRLTEMDLISDRRTANLVKPRQIAMYLCKTLSTLSLPRIGRRFGGRDHTTVLHAIRKITALIEIDAELAAEVDELKQALQG